MDAGFTAVEAFGKFLVTTFCISVPLALWKLVDIIIWIIKNISITLG
jgi:hypothetical protein